MSNTYHINFKINNYNIIIKLFIKWHASVKCHYKQVSNLNQYLNVKSNKNIKNMSYKHHIQLQPKNIEF